MSEAVERLTAWAESRGQKVYVSEDAATAFVTMRDPRLGPWDFDDTRLAIVLRRRTLPWLHTPPVMTNAIAGPQTATPRGVSR